MSTTHYHITANIPGCLPTAEPYLVLRQAEAKAALNEEVRQYSLGEAELPPSARRTNVQWFGGDEANVVLFSRPGDPFDQGYALAWSVCDAAECLEDI